MWLHRPFRADEWMLYVQDSPSASGALGFSRGAVYSRDGALIASVAQEGLIRRRTEASPNLAQLMVDHYLSIFAYLLGKSPYF